MDTMLILAKQILQMFLLAGAGYLLFRGKKISPEGSKTLGNILIYAALPATIVKGFLVERTASSMLGVLYSGLGAAALLLIAILLSRWLFPGDGIAAFAAAFANPGFFGIPLIVASLGSGAGYAWGRCFRVRSNGHFAVHYRETDSGAGDRR